VKATLWAVHAKTISTKLTSRAEAVELKRKIEAAQKDARDGVDASMKEKTHNHEQEKRVRLESDVNTGRSPLSDVGGYRR
jgi:hypothetical protein